MTTREAVIESLAGANVTSFQGRRPKAADIDTLEKELATIAAKIKTTILPQGNRFGHLCCVISDEAYGTKIEDPDFELALHEPTQPAAYNPEITANTPDHMRRTLEAEWEQHKKDVVKYDAVQEVLVSKIVGAVDIAHIREKWDEFAAWDGRTCREMIDHLRDRFKLTATERARMRDEINFDWDQTIDFESYIIKLEEIRSKLKRWDIDIDDNTLIDTAAKQVNRSNVFTKDHRKQWDELDDTDKHWEVYKNHFIECYNEEERYAEETAGRGGLQGINEVQDEEAAADELTDYLYQVKLAATDSKEEIQAVSAKLGAVEEFAKKIKSLSDTIASQQKVIASQQETIKTLTNKIGGGGGTNNRNVGGTGGKKEKKKCFNCGKLVYHKAEDCLELPANEGKRMAGWKSVYEGQKNPHYPERN